MTRARRTCKTLALLLVLCTLLALLPAASADAAEADQGFTVECSGNIFTIRRSDTSSAADVNYRTVSQSAVEGIHFTAASGMLHFNPGDSSRTVAVSEVRAVASADFFYLDGSARTYGFEVLTTGGRTLASCQRILDSAGELALSSGLYSAKSAAVFTAETKVTDKGYNQAYYPVPLDAYSAGEMDYFDLTGARLRMTVDLEAKEADDGYQYIQIIANSSGNDSGAGSGNPGTVSLSSYMAGFGHDPGSKNTSYAKYTFPLTTAGNNCAAIEPAWNFSPYNNSVGKLYTQKFAASARADDGRIILPENLRTLGIRLNASGDNDDDWYAKNVTAKLQAADTTAPTLLGVYVTDGVYGYRDTITAALRFSEVVRIVGTNPYLNTNMGSFSYAGGSGTNVLYFTRFLNTSLGAKNGLEISGIGNSTNIHDLSTKAFTGSYTASFPNVSYEGSVSVTINYNNGSGATANAGSYYLGAVYTFPEAARYQSHAPQGRELDCYKVGETAYQPGDTLELTENLTVDLQWKPIVYTVRFVNHDGTVLQSGSVTYGETPEYTGETPTRPADAQYTYTFSGWTPEITAVSSDTTYTASYSTTTNPYTVTFKNYDGTVLQSGPVPYGETPAYAGPAPTKEPTTETDYIFAGWTPELAPVTGEAAYTAVFTEAARPYTVTFKNYDGTVLQSGPVPYGETPEYTGETPARPDEGETGYTFSGWTPEITAVAGEATYTASYSTTRLYPVTLPEGITADKAFAAPGKLVTLTAPEAYTVALTYTPEGGEAAAVLETEGAYTFTMPAAPVTVGADFSLTWEGLQTLLDAGGTVKLLSDVTADADSSWLEVPWDVTVTLDLNGHTIDRALTEAVPGGNVLRIDGSLTLRDSSAGGAGRITGGYSTTICGGVYVFEYGMFTMEGGAITDNTADYGGGVYVEAGGTFTMTGGTISGNSSNFGGGVYVNDGTINMTGGTITDNTAVFGGGVFVDSFGTINMTGGMISGNTASGNGGGVYVFDGTINMTGGTISGNTANYGGGVYVFGTFRVSGSPVVTGNLSGSSPNNVYLASGKTIGISGPLTEGASLGVKMKNITGCFTDGWADQMGTADPADFFTSDNSAYPVNHRPGSEALLGVLHAVSIADGIELGTVTADKASACEGEAVTLTVTPEPGFELETLTVKQGETEVTASANGNNEYTFLMPDGDVTVTATFRMTWAGLQTLLDAGGTVKLLCDVTADEDSSCLFVPSDVTVTLDLNGHILSRGLTEATTNGYVIGIQGGSLTLTDSAPDTTHDGTDVTGGILTGGYNRSTYGGGVYVNGGSLTMSGGTVTGNAASGNGGVYVNDGTFTMTGGTITDNTTSDKGGGVYVSSYGTFNMTGGTISGNSASWGGGLYVDGTFTMEGGTITGNSASWGGGLYVDDTFNMTGGTISGNSASWGGGVYVSIYGTFRVSGSPVVTGNLRNGAPNNVYLYNDRKISISGPLTEGSSLGVTMRGVTGIFTSGWADQMGTADPADFFTSDNNAYMVGLRADGEALLGVPHTVSIADGIEHGTVTADKASACEGEAVTLTVTPETGYALDTLTVMQGETEVTASANGNNEYTFLMPDGDVTVTATFRMTWAGLNAALQSDCAITLLYDITAESSDGPLVIPGGVTVTLDLNGHILSRGLRASTSDGYVIGIQSGGSLTLTDSAPDTTHDGTDVTGGILTGGYNRSNYGGGVYVNGGSLTMSGGTVTGNRAQNGGGVAVCSDSTFTMYGGTITGNTTGQDGGGVYVFGKTGNAVFIMESGTISNNTANGRGGGVHVGSFNSRITMYGGTISGNTAQNGGGVLVNGHLTMEGGTVTGNTAQNGGGVYVNGGSLTMSGGTVTGNTAIQNGGGVYNNGTFMVAGSPVVTDNLGYDEPDNVYLYRDRKLSLSGPLTEGASLGVTMMNSTGIFTSGWADQMGDADPAGFFTSDNSAYQLGLSADGEALSGVPHTVSIADGIEHGTVTADKASACEGEAVTLTVTPETGFALDVLSVMHGEREVIVDHDRFTMPAGDVTVTATFRPAFGTPDFTMPAALQIIEESAFEGLTLLHVVDADSVTVIGKWAFKDTGLTQIRLLQNCAIDADAFDGCGTVYVFAPAGGTTESFCQNRPGIVFVAE